MSFETLYLGGEYLITKTCDYFQKKYSGQISFVLENTVENVLGSDWIKSNPIMTTNLQSRCEGVDLNKEIVLYGKIKETGSVFLISEFVLLSEIAFAKSIQEFNELKKLKKIKELKIKN